MKKLELLAPAGNLEKLKFAILYGADAVYLAGKSYGLRAKAGNFDMEQMQEGVNFAHERGKKVYVTINIIAHNEDLVYLDKYIKDIAQIGVDAVIVADPGVMQIVKESAPELPIFLSTQANNTNWRSAKFWHDMGVKRVILAREMSLEEMKEIVNKTPDSLDVECFIHGAMCISYSGRCLLSNYLANRDSNKGDCAHPCRWNYFLVEETRPDQHFTLQEDERGTYIFNSKDMCLIEHIPDLIDAGISSFKIEGRMKSVYYVATVVSAYRRAIDNYLKDPNNNKVEDNLVNELKKVSHREYTKGFLFDKPGHTEQNYDFSSYIRNYDFAGVVLGYDKETKIATIEQRNKLVIGDKVEVISPGRDCFLQKINGLYDEKENGIESTPHPKMIFKMKMDKQVNTYDIIRKERI